MAITSAIASSFKQELLQGKHNFSASGGDTFKIALFTSSASLGASTTDYSTSNEITNTSGTAYTSATFTANGALIYNTTTGTGSSTTDAVAVIAFGADKTVTSGTFTIQFPTANATDAIIRLA